MKLVYILHTDCLSRVDVKNGFGMTFDSNCQRSTKFVDL